MLISLTLSAFAGYGIYTDPRRRDSSVRQTGSKFIIKVEDLHLVIIGIEPATFFSRQFNGIFNASKLPGKVFKDERSFITRNFQF
jgi:hypothetical protein